MRNSAHKYLHLLCCLIKINGVIRNSKKLYYIGDWIDEYCDLTLDVIIKKLGKPVKTINTEVIANNLENIITNL